MESNKDIRIRFPNISIEEDDEPKHSTSEIFKAVADNDPKSLEFLIKEGFAVNLRDSHTMTPLHAVCARGLTDLCLILLNSGAFIDTPTGTPPFKTALHIAVSGGHFPIVQLLIKKYKADWRKLDSWGWNILHEAVVDGSPQIIRFIMRECRELSNQAMILLQDGNILIC